MLTKTKKCATELLSVYAQKIDTEIAADRAGRRKMGFSIQRRADERKIQTLVGEVSYHRNDYKNASGGYEYLTDMVLGVNHRERVSEGLSLALATAAKDMSYEKSSRYVSNGEISRQTVMSRVRRGKAIEETVERRCIPELHIDADEAHVTMQNGSKSIVPLISFYEGIERLGKRGICKNVHHISEYGKSSDDLWEQALSKIERRYDLSGTKIYLHGDGGSWIQMGLEWIPTAVFVLDKYHKNKAIKQMTAGFDLKTRKEFDENIREALATEDLQFFDELTQSIAWQIPKRADKIFTSAGYLKKFSGGISVCKTDPHANNGGCTEPHVSHVLSARLSSRPRAWSKTTLQKLAPILACGKVSLISKSEVFPLPAPLQRAAVTAKKTLQRQTSGLPAPDSIGVLPISGKTTGTQKLLKFFSK